MTQITAPPVARMGMVDRILVMVVSGAIMMMLGYLISSVGDRYHGNDAARDFEQIRAEIDLVERRTNERLIEHKSGGPHDDVKERITILETRFAIIIDELREIKEVIRERNSDK